MEKALPGTGSDESAVPGSGNVPGPEVPPGLEEPSVGLATGVEKIEEAPVPRVHDGEEDDWSSMPLPSRQP